MLRRLALRDFVIVPALELEFEAGFSVLTGETGAGKSILIDALQLDDLLEHFDGIVMTGAVSNVHPPHYGEQPSTAHEPYDHGRDATTLKLIEKVLKRGLPLFCICRGFQELNVVLGGTLETELQTIEGRLDHRAPQHDDVDVRYAPSHAINIR